MVKWPFGRKQSSDSDKVPQEIQEYYQSEKRERVGVAWMLALATLVVTVLLALGIFYGGRWAYRALFDDNGDNTPAEQEQGDEQSQTSDDEADGGTDAPATLPGDGTDSNGSAEDNDTPARTPQTGPTLPETGPSDNL